MYRSHTCGELRLNDVGQSIKLAGWVQRVRNLGGMTFIDLRDRYGITQLVIGEDTDAEVRKIAEKIGREYVLQVEGEVVERSSKNPNMDTGDVEIEVKAIKVLNEAKTPPFTIEDKSDGGDDLRLRYRYLDLRRNPLQKALKLRHELAMGTREYLSDEGFLEIETPFMIKSTPEGARDFVVPSRMNPGEFYALPQSPQTFKQLLMVGGYDRYFQIVRCFRDEDLRADRQPEFTQIDCEMSFVERKDVIETFEGMMKHLFKKTLNVEMNEPYPHMTWHDAMDRYGSDKPDIRFGMELNDITKEAQTRDFRVFNDSQYVGAIVAEGCSEYTRRQLDDLTDFVRRPQVGAMGLVWVRYDKGGEVRSSVGKFFGEEEYRAWAEKCGAKEGDLMLIISGDRRPSQKALCALRLHLGDELGLRKRDEFAPLWVVDFPLLEWDDETERFYAVHHPFTSPLEEDFELLESAPAEVRADAYDFVVNGVEVGGGSIRIHDSKLQAKMFDVLGFTAEEAESQFGFLMNAFKFGAPPHGGIAFGFDRLCSLFGGSESIRDFIAFPKNTAGRDVMADAPSPISAEQLDELAISLIERPKKESK